MGTYILKRIVGSILILLLIMVVTFLLMNAIPGSPFLTEKSTPEQIASAVAFLCSDAAATISGAEIPIDSGIGVCLLAYNKNWIQNDPYNVKYWEKK